MRTLQERLSTMKAANLKRIPAELVAIISRATEDLRASGIMEGVAEVGAPLPPFELADTEGGLVRSSEVLAQGPLVLSFYRGLW